MISLIKRYNNLHGIIFDWFSTIEHILDLQIWPNIDNVYEDFIFCCKLIDNYLFNNIFNKVYTITSFNSFPNYYYSQKRISQ